MRSVFHDSGIRLIYDDIWVKHRKVQEIGTRLLEAAYRALYPGTQTIPEDGFAPIYHADQVVPISAMGIERRELIPVKCGRKGSWCRQYDSKTSIGYVLACSPSSTAQAELQTDARAFVSVSQQNSTSCQLATATVKLDIKDGRIVSLFDESLQRELIPEDQTGGFIIYEDQPANWDAWDVDVFHLEKFKRLRFDEVNIVEHGPMRASILGHTRFGSSKMEVKVGSLSVPA